MLKKKHAFTLIEWVLAIAIIGLLFAGGAASIPYLMRKERFLSSSEMLLQKIQFAKALAFQLNKNVTVHLWQQNGQYYCSLDIPNTAQFEEKKFSSQRTDLKIAENLLNRHKLLKEVHQIDDGLVAIDDVQIIMDCHFGAQNNYQIRLHSKNAELEKIIFIDSSPHYSDHLTPLNHITSTIPTYPKDVIDEEALSYEER
ncbi:MAG: prepilin-type N-terminal cleavage/methylation domain-containing protein [Parachlamydiales bacterium]|nr:prepilin-type N-terminal cleavage/methylation domain-containing protein [Parachlamydiales bacterium]